MIQSPSKSRISLAAFLLALLASPHDGSSFSLSRIPLEAARPITSPLAPSTASHRHRTLPLHSTVDSPMRPMEEEEREKNSKQKNDEDQKEWKQVVGGFVPKFLKRDADTKNYPTVEMVDTIADYKRVVVDEEDQIVVVRFFAPWCKSCKAAHPHFKKMVSHHSPSVKFVEVPLTKDTAYIHEGLGVPSVPFGHIYHPDVGLVEEKKINRKVFKEFRESLDSYVRGSCDVPMEEEQEDENVTDGGFQ
mmetsp:Transcript_7074/g.13173  ORF Transcript_7074/g.13173 Transcript_7074/m.13173 type:complete len:247 (+) Transcript_7074:120-860(+)